MNLLAYSMVGVWLGCAAFYKAFGTLREKQLIQDLPVSKIGALAMGLVEIQGAAKQDPPLTSPISKQPCAYYMLVVKEIPRVGNNPPVTIAEESSGPFVLDDGTGQALIDTARADIQFDSKSFFFGGKSSAMPEACHEYFKANGLKEKTWVMDKTVEIEERTIPLDHPLFVLGAAAPITDEQAPSPCKARIAYDPNTKLHVISEVSQKEFFGQLGSTVWMGLLGGPILVVASLGCLLVFFFQSLT